MGQGQKMQTSYFERLSYGGFFLGQNIIYVLQFQFLSYFYINVVRIPIAQTTLLLLISRLWDTFDDPIVGAIVDKCNFKSGKYLPWLKVVTYIVPLSLIFVFVNFNMSPSANIVYAYVTYLLWGILYTFSDAPLFSLSTAMTSNIYERDKLLSYGRFAAAFAAILSAVFITLKDATNWTGAIAIYCLFAFLVMFPLQFSAKERVKYKRSDNISFLEIFKYLFKNKYLLIYYIGYFFLTATNSLQVMAVYFVNSNLGNEGYFMLIMAVSIIPVLIIAPMLPLLIKKFGKRKLTVVCCLLALVFSIVQYFSGYENIVVFLIISAVRVVFMQVPLLIYGMFTADCIEYNAYVNGKRTEGIAFAVQTLITKFGGAICQSACLLLIGAFGYIGGVDGGVATNIVQSESAKHGIWLTMTLLPVIGFIAMIITMKFYDLKEKDVEIMIKANEITQ